MTGRGETAPRAPTDSQEATTHRQSSRSFSDHPLSLSDLAHVDFERKTTRADITQIELLGRDGIDSFCVTPWTTHDEDPTAFQDVVSLSDSVEAQARSFSSPSQVSAHHYHQTQDPSGRQQEVGSQQIPSYGLHCQDSPPSERHDTRVTFSGRVSPTLVAIGTHETLITDDFIGPSNGMITSMPWPDTIDEGMDTLLPNNRHLLPSPRGRKPWH